MMPTAPVMSEPYLTFTVNVQLQPDLELAGVGSAGIVFKVHNEDIVLKARRIYEPPSSESSIEDKKHYAEETLFHYRLMEDERAIMLQLEKQPHPNIIEVIDTSYPEGNNLRISQITTDLSCRYLSLQVSNAVRNRSPHAIESDPMVSGYRTRSVTYS